MTTDRFADCRSSRLSGVEPLAVGYASDEGGESGGPVRVQSKRPCCEPYDGGMSHTVVAELVAAVMKVEVHVGQTVAADDPVVILESMKMEIPVLADVAGSVSEVVVAAGDVVNDGDPLVVIKVNKV
jgi:acetyl-CoA carboxylase biotin carboxyl carrier protein